MNNTPDSEKREKFVELSKSASTLLAVGGIAFIVVVGLLLVLLLIFGWQLIYMI